MKSMQLVLACTALAATLTAAPAALAQVAVSSGAEYTTGKYGTTQSTDSLYIPFIARYQAGPWTFKATVPYLRISGPANVIGAGAERVTLPDDDDDDDATRTESGLGDVVASAFYSLTDERESGFGLEVGGKVKVATADETRGLGTGEHDFSVQADLFVPLGSATAFGTLGYRWYGDPPGVKLRDVPYYAIGASYPVAADRIIGLAYDFRPKITAAGAELSELTAFWSRRFSQAWKVQLYGVIGFSDASPDAGFGALLEHRF